MVPMSADSGALPRSLTVPLPSWPSSLALHPLLRVVDVDVGGADAAVLPHQLVEVRVQLELGRARGAAQVGSSASTKPANAAVRPSCLRRPRLKPPTLGVEDLGLVFKPGELAAMEGDAQRDLGVDVDLADDRAAEVEVGGGFLLMHAQAEAQAADVGVAHAQAAAGEVELDVGVDHRALEAALQLEVPGVHVARRDRVELAPDLDVAGDDRRRVLLLRAPDQRAVHEVDAGRQLAHVDAHAGAEALDVEAPAQVAAGRLVDDQVERRWGASSP
jgi:hypothetical protein